jgi:transposase
VLAELPELGTLNHRQAAALAGGVPIRARAAPGRGRRTPGGGRAAVRRALYMTALVAARASRTRRAFYLRLRSAGKPAQVALRAVMRKPVILMQRVLKNPHFDLATYRCC